MTRTGRPTARLISALIVLAWGTAARGAAGDAVDTQLSGTYEVRYEQEARSCGRPLKPVVERAEVVVGLNTIKARFEKEFLGLRSVDLKFDRASGSSDTRLEQRVDLGATGALLTLDVHLQMRADADPPVFDFTVRFRKAADDPAWNCEVRGKGSALRVDGPSESC